MNKGKLEKSIEITDAKIRFVSLVGKAANKHTFLMTKQEDGKATFTSYGRILKADAESHYVTGIVYEPMTEDTDGNFMTEDEITKACHWFAKNSNQVDLQHSFEPLGDASVVENWIAKSDCDIEGNEVKKGTWLMTVEVTDPDVWQAIEKGDITGFSMGGIGTYGDEDVDLNEVEKDEKVRKGLFKRLAGAFGLDVVEKGQVADLYNTKIKARNFWAAHDALEEVLSHWDYVSDSTVFETDEAVIQEALEDYSSIITELLSGNGIAKSLYLAKSEATKEEAGKAESGDAKGAAEDEDEDKKSLTKEVDTMSQQELEKAVVEAVRKAMAEPEPAPAANTEPVNKAEEPAPAEHIEITEELIQKMVSEAVEKAVAPQSEQHDPGWIEALIEKAVNEKVAPILSARGLPHNLNGDGEVEKSASEPEEHYLHGIL